MALGTRMRAEVKDPGLRGWVSLVPRRFAWAAWIKLNEVNKPKRLGTRLRLGQAVDLRRNSDAEAWSHSICIPP